MAAIEAAISAIEKSLSEKVPFVIGDGVPVSAPYFAGQMYYNRLAADTEVKWYYSHEVTSGVFDWYELSADGSGGVGSGVTRYTLTDLVYNASIAPISPTPGGLYLLNTSPAHIDWNLPSTVPAGTIIRYSSTAYASEVVVDLTTLTGETVIAEYTDMWALISGENGTWLNIPGYSTALDDAITSADPVGGYPAGTTVGEVRTKTWNEIIDIMLFAAKLPTYELPILTTSDDVYYERGTDVFGNLLFDFKRKDAGDATGSTLTFLDNVGSTLWTTPVGVSTGDFITTVDLDDPSYDVVVDPSVGNYNTVKYAIDYATSALKNDSHNVPDSRPTDPTGENGPLPASIIEASSRYGSSWPVFVGATNDSTLSPPTLDDTLPPENFDELWVRANMSKTLFPQGTPVPYSVDIPVPTGSEYILVVCPPGKSVTEAADLEFGFTYPALVTQKSTLYINDASGLNPEIFNYHYFRNVSTGGWAENQTITVTIQ